jgi:hypothetical protein
MTKIGSLGITVVLFSLLNTFAQAQGRQTSPGDYLQRLFERTGARHRNARRNLETILRAPPEFLGELHAVAGRLKTDPAWLLNVMACESLFDPDARNPLPGQTASGLLQIIEGTARRLGTTTKAIRRMSPVDQLRLVEKYLEPFKGRLNTLPNVYMAVFRGSIVEGDDTIVVVNSAKEPRIYALNKSLDIDNDKRITKGELGLAALSVGRFLPAPQHRGKAKNSSPVQAPRATRSIYIRREKPRVIETSPSPANRGG